MTRSTWLGSCAKVASSVRIGFKSAVLAAGLISAASGHAQEVGYPEKEELKFGFIKLTDMAPLAVAYEKRFLKTKAYTSLWKHKLTGKYC